MKNLFLLIKTFSSRSVAKVRPYAYSEAFDFEVLLLAFSIDGQPVQLVDLASGEKIPRKVLAALKDESVVKWTTRYEFERISLYRYLGDPTDECFSPRGWRSLLAWATMAGLPCSLKRAAAILGLEWPSKEIGLDDYFCHPCTPTFANGRRSRNLPRHDPDKWRMFKAQSLRTVQAMLALHGRLASYPISEGLWNEFYIDQQINDLGVAVDKDLVRQALLLSEEVEQPLASMLRKLYIQFSLITCSDGRAHGLNKFFVTALGGQRMIGLHTLSGLPMSTPQDVAQARSLLLSDDIDGLQELCNNVPNPVSMLFFAALVPSPGNEFIVAKFADIETRIITWLSGTDSQETSLWLDIDQAALDAVRRKCEVETHGIRFSWMEEQLCITLPSGRCMIFVAPMIDTESFGGDHITSMGLNEEGKWERQTISGPGLADIIVRAIVRDIHCFALKTLQSCSVVMYGQDGIVLEAGPHLSLGGVLMQMKQTPPWAKGLALHAEGYETEHYTEG